MQYDNLYRVLTGGGKKVNLSRTALTTVDLPLRFIIFHRLYVLGNWIDLDKILQMNGGVR